MKKTISLIMMVVLILSYVTGSFAGTLAKFERNSSTDWTLRSDLKHMGSTSTTYKITEYTRPINVEVFFTAAGINKWGCISSTQCTYDKDSTVGEIYFDDGDVQVPYVARVTINANTSGHINKWKIKIFRDNYYNRSENEQQPAYMAHAFGLAYGLEPMITNGAMNKSISGDLPGLGTNSYIPESEKMGMKIVTHQHLHGTTGNYTYSEPTSTQHKVSCSDCNSYFLQNHTATYTSLGATGHRVTKCTHCTYSSTKTEPHTFTYRSGRYYCNSCDYSTTDPGGGTT